MLIKTQFYEGGLFTQIYPTLFLQVEKVQTKSETVIYINYISDGPVQNSGYRC